MDIIKSYQDVIEKYDGDLSGICQLALDKKNNQYNFHAGHEYMLELAKDTGKDILISFNNTGTFTKTFYTGNTYKESGSDLEGNYMACYNWCKEHDVEMFWWISDTMLRSNASDGHQAKEWVEQLWNDNDLDAFITSVNRDDMLIQRIKARMIYKRGCQLNWTVISSWKDGYVRAYDKWFSDRYSKEDFILVDPILNDKGVYYSRHSDMYSDDENEVLSELDEYAQIINKDNLHDIFKKLYKKLYVNGIILKDITILSEELVGLPITQFTVSKNKIAEIYPYKRIANE